MQGRCQTNSSRKRLSAGLAAVMVVAILSGCGGGGGGDPAPPLEPTRASDLILVGTAAVGAALQGATVQIKCVDGDSQATTDAQGNYRITLRTVQFPCLLQARGGRTQAGANTENLASLLASVPTAADFANLTPLTHLLTARVLGQDPAQAFTACCANSAQTARITGAALTAAQAQVREQIRSKLGVDVPELDWVRGSFAAEPSNLMDQALERFGQKRQQFGRSLTQIATEIAAGNGDLSLPTLAADAVECTPGLIAGFTGKFDDELIRVRRGNPADIGGGGSSGAGGSGAGGSEGQLLNVEMTVETRDPIFGKTIFGPVKTDAVSGMATFVPCGYTGPALFTARGVAGSLYFDEARGGNPVSFQDQTLRVAVESITKNVGITRLTEAAVALIAQLSVSGDGGSVLKAVAEPWHDVGRIAIANNAVRSAINDQLPSPYRLDDITRLPVVIGAANANTPGILTNNQNGVYGALLAGLAKTGASFLPSSSTPALAIGSQLVADLSDGTLNQRNRATPVAVRTSAQAYSYSSLSSALTINVGTTLTQLGQGTLQTRKFPIQRVDAPIPSSTNRWSFTLLSDGTVSVGRPAGTTAIVFPPYSVVGGVVKRIGRLDVVQRSATNIAAETANCSNLTGAAKTSCDQANAWDQCLSALSTDGTTVFSWRVGLSASAYQTGTNPSSKNALYNVETTVINPIVSMSPASYDFGPQDGQMNTLALLQDGSLKSVAQCGLNDFHPGIADFPSRDITMSFQDGGNRYVLFSNGTIRVWGLNATAMGIGQALIDSANLAGGTVGASDHQPVLDTGGGSASLADVVMLTSAGAAYQPRALVRTGSDPAVAGTVLVWGAGIPRARQIPSLQGICWISGPYAVGCDGRLVHVAVTAGTGGAISAVQSAISSSVPIWRIKEESVPITVQRSGQQVARVFQAIGRDGSVFRLTGTTLTKLADPP